MTLPQIDTGALFDVTGKSAIVVGATGSFGKVVCATLGKAGARLTVTAGNAAELDALAVELAAAGIDAVAVNRRPNSEADCDAIVDRAIAAYGGVDILVIASGVNDVAMIGDLTPERFQKVMLANVDGAWLMARAAGNADDRARAWRQGGIHLIGAGQAGTSRRILGLLHIQIRRRWADQGAGLRMGQARHHGERDRAYRVSLAANGLDVRG